MSTKSVCDMSCGAMHEFALALDKAGFDADLVQKIVASRGNKDARRMYAVLNDGAQVDYRFELVNTFDLVVPEGYNHATRLATFEKEHRREFHYWDDVITDENYSKATTKLVPGRKFKVKVFQIKETVTSEDCLAKLRSENAVLVGAQGASIAYELWKDKLPFGLWSVSFDEKEGLWKDAAGAHRVPSVDRHSDGGFKWSLGYFEDVWIGDFCLLCFCDLPDESANQAEKSGG